MFSLRNKKHYLWIILNTPSYLEICIQYITPIIDSYILCLQDKLGELQALVMQLMGEKNMLHSYAQESRRPVSPMFDPHAIQSQHLVNGKPNGEILQG